MSHFSMFFPTKDTVKLANGNTVHDQVIGIILCLFPKLPIIYLLGTVYYFPGRPSNTISFYALKFYVGFQKVAYEPFEHCDYFDPQGSYWRSPYQDQNNLDFLRIEIVKFNPQRDRNIMVPTVCAL